MSAPHQYAINHTVKRKGAHLRAVGTITHLLDPGFVLVEWNKVFTQSRYSMEYEPNLERVPNTHRS